MSCVPPESPGPNLIAFSYYQLWSLLPSSSSFFVCVLISKATRGVNNSLLLLRHVTFIIILLVGHFFLFFIFSLTNPPPFAKKLCRVWQIGSIVIDARTPNTWKIWASSTRSWPLKKKISENRKSRSCQWPLYLPSNLDSRVTHPHTQTDISPKWIYRNCLQVRNVLKKNKDALNRETLTEFLDRCCTPSREPSCSWADRHFRLHKGQGQQKFFFSLFRSFHS